VAIEQRILAADQLKAFYHDEFVEDQVRDFGVLVPRGEVRGVVVDIGGGCGYFARRLADIEGVKTRVIDQDPSSVEASRGIGVEAEPGDALAPSPAGDEGIVCFNLILHHLVGPTDGATRALQIKALRSWRGKVPVLFVNEYIYESFVGTVSGRLIYAITSSRLLSAVGVGIARLVPAFRANTFGVGVRFRSHQEWLTLFAEAGFHVVGTRIGVPERISPPLRSLLISVIRRDSFRLEPIR
jgi:hypothetical protein